MSDDKIEQLARQYTRDELLMALRRQAELGENRWVDKDSENYIVPSMPHLHIEELDLSQRSFNCLRRFEVRYLSDIVQLSADELRSIRGFGKVSLLEVKTVVKEYGGRLYPQSRWMEAIKLGDWIEKNITQTELESSSFQFWKYYGMDNQFYPVLYRMAIEVLQARDIADPVEFMRGHGFCL